MRRLLSILTASILALLCFAACSLEADVPHPPAYDPKAGQQGTDSSASQHPGVAVIEPSGKYSVRTNNLKITTYYISKGVLEDPDARTAGLKEDKAASPDGSPAASLPDISGLYFGPDPSNLFGALVQISGLKDKALEKEINSRILSRFASCYADTGIPPYVGAKLKEKELRDWTLQSRYCYVETGLNAENILSVMFSSDNGYTKGKSSGYFSVHKFECMNIDLRTGKEIQITDLFADGAAGLAYLDSLVGDHITKYDSYDDRMDTPLWYDSGLSLAMPFPGIREDQKFFIHQSTGQIFLIFDYNTPWVYCDYRARTLAFDTVPYMDLSRFASDKCIFEDETEDFWLLSRPYDHTDMVTENRNDDLETGSQGMKSYIHSSVSYFKDMPPAQVKYVQTSAGVLDRMTDTYRRKKDELNELYNGYIHSELNISGYSTRTGDFTNVTNYAQIHIYRTVYPNDILYDESWENYSVFRGDSDRPETFETIFKPGVDWEERLYRAFKANWQRVLELPEDEGLGGTVRFLNAGYIRSLGIDPDALDGFFREAAGSSPSFRIENDYLSLGYGQKLRDLSLKYFGNTGDGKPDNDILFAVEALAGGARYRDLGAGDMTIF